MARNNKPEAGSEADRASQQRQMISGEKLPIATINLSQDPLLRSKTIYLFVFVIYLPYLVSTLQLPQVQQQQPTGLENLVQQQQEARCLSCIRNVSSTGIDLTKRCEGYYCGPYQFSYQYWAEAGKPGNSQGTRDYEKCARDKQCAESTVKAYFKKFKRDCNHDGLVDCLDMAALHKGGPQSCSLDWFYKSRYWQAFNKTACATDKDSFNLAAQKPNPDKKVSLDGQASRQPQLVMKNQTLTSECLDCICEALTSCSSTQSLSASNCGSNHVCGPFAISQSYWKDGRRPGASWTACARTKECSTVTIRNYMDKHKRDCNGDGFVTCEDYAAIHKRGPKSCMNRDLLKEQFWARFLACRANQKPNNDANLVKVDEDDSQIVNSLASRGVPAIAASSSQQASASPNTTATQASPTPEATLVSSKAQDVDRYEYSSPTLSTPETTPKYGNPIPDELVPIITENKQQAIGMPTRTYQTVQPTTTSIMTSTTRRNGLYEHSGENLPDNESAHDQSHGASPLETSSSRATPSSSSLDDHLKASQTTKIYQDYSQPHHPPKTPMRPAIDYNSLPTIIVSKPLGSLSTSRVSSPPQSPHYLSSSPQDNQPADKSQTPIQTMTTLGMTTTPRPPSPALSSFATTIQSFASSELDTSTTSRKSSPASQVVPGGQDDLASVEYGVPDFEPNAGPTVSSFDRVVNGIVGSPDFSKAQPPVPELVQQRKQPDNPPRGPPLTSSTINSQSSSSTRVRDQWSPSSSTPSMSVANSGNKRENSKTLSPNYSLNSDDGSGSPSDASTLTGPDALNMTSLFEKSGLNETSRIPNECLDCICDASSNCDTSVQCISKQREKNRCAATSASSPTSASPASAAHQNDDLDEKLYYECSTDRNCAEKLIHLYIEKYSKDCNHDGKIDCYDIAALHRVGPDNCNSHKFLGSQYWRDFNHCYATDRLTTTVQPQSSSQGVS